MACTWAWQTVDVGEVTRRVSAVVSRASGNTVGPAVAALWSMAGLALGEPALTVAAVPVGAVAGSLTEEAVSAVGLLWQQRRDRIQRFADEAETSSGTRMEQLLVEAEADPRTLEMLARGVEAAARSLDDRKIDLLARIFVSGVRDRAKVDEAIILIEALRQLEAPHLRLLTVLSKPGPHLVPGQATEDRPRTPENMARIAVWGVEDILTEDPGLREAFDALVARLNALGLVYDEGSGRLDYEPLWFLTSLGQASVRYLGDRGRDLRDGSQAST
jgi:hypothetical protein